MGWYEAMKDALAIAQKADNVDLISRILDLQNEIQELQHENFELTTKIEDMKKILNRKGNIEYDEERNAVYELVNGERQGPYCTRCWEADGKLISLHGDNGFKSCPECKTSIRVGQSVIYSQETGSKITVI